MKQLADVAEIDPEDLSGDTDPGFEFNYISLEQVEMGRLLDSTSITFRAAPQRARRVLRENDVLLSTVRPNRMAHLFFRGQVKNAVCSTGFAVIRSKSCMSDPGFLFAQLFGHVVNKQISRMIAGSNYPAINSGDVGTIEIPYPPTIEEQRAIAEALSDVDGLLESLATLIAKKRAVKTATMQQLLTGRTRLPGFSGEWETKQLVELGVFSKGRGIKRSDVRDDGYPCIRYGELYTRYSDFVASPVARIPASVALTAQPIENGDLLFAGAGETPDEIGRCAAYVGENTAYAGGDLIILSPFRRAINSLYLGYLLNHPTVSVQKARLAQGDAIVHISSGSLGQVQIELPPVEEQTAIAAVLSDMDAEISALDSRIGKVRAVKQGMMQQLLTGRIRLPTADAPARDQVESVEEDPVGALPMRGG